jgi:hypothetical protein
MQSQSGRSDIFLAYSQRPQQTSTASKAETNVFLLPALIDDIPEIQKMKMLLEPGLLAVPLPWGHWGIPTASQSSTNVFLLPALIDDITKNTSPRKTKVGNGFGARAFGRPSSLGPRLHKAPLMSFFLSQCLWLALFPWATAE